MRYKWDQVIEELRNYFNYQCDAEWFNRNEILNLLDKYDNIEDDYNSIKIRELLTILIYKRYIYNNNDDGRNIDEKTVEHTYD